MSDRNGPESLEQELIRALPTGMGIFDVTGDAVERKYNNDGYYQMIGARREDRRQFFGTTTVEAIHPDDRAGLLAEARAAVRERRLFQYRFRVLSGSGKYEWISIRANHVPLSDRTERFYAAYYNIDALIGREQELKTILESENTLVGLIQLLNEPNGFSRNTGELLARLGAYFEADRTYIFDFDTGRGTADNTHEWCREGVAPQREHLQKVELAYAERWMPFFESHQCVVVPEIEEIRALQPKEYEIMSRQGIQSYVEAPFFIDGRFAGFIGIDNPSKDKIRHAGSPLLALADSLASAIARTESNRLLREQAEKLRRSEEAERTLRNAYEAFIESVELFIWEYDVPTHTVTLMDNPFTRRRSAELGFPRVIGNVPECLMDKVDAHNAEILRALYADVEAGKPKTSCVVRFTPAAGQATLALRLSYATSLDDGGKPSKAYGTSQNITKQWAASDRYNQELAFFTGANDENLIARGRHDLTQNRVLVHFAASCEALALRDGATCDEAYAAFRELPVDEADRRKIADTVNRKNLLSLYSHGQNSFVCDYRRKKAVAATLWARTEIRLCENPETGNLEAFLYTRDITQQHLEKMIVQRMTDLGYDYIGVIDPVARTYTFRGSRFPSGHGTELDTFDYDGSVLKSARAHVAPDELDAVLEAGSLEKIRAELEKNGSYSFAYNFIDFDGSVLRKLFQYCYLDEERQNIFFCKSDITRQYRQEQEQLQQLRTALEAAEQASVAKTEFLSRMSHEIRTPMNAIIGLDAIALQEKGLTAATEDHLQKIGISARFLLSLINDILDMSRIESGKMALRSELFNFEEFIGGINTILYEQCRANEQDYECVLKSYTEEYYVGDKTKLQQVLINILGNSVKFTPKGGKVHFMVEQVSRTKTKAKLRFEISDTGIGIDEEFLPHLFEAFTQENRGRTSAYGGTGLGLAISRNIVRLMNGEITVHSIKGVGSEFTVEVELSLPEETVRRREKLGRDQLLPLNTLIVDDDVIVCRHTQLLLTEAGLKAEWAASGEEAVEKVRENRRTEADYDLILLDWKMPDMDGIETAREIRKIVGPEVTIIIMTAYDWADIEEKARLAGVDMFMKKPVFASSVTRAFENVFLRKQGEGVAAAEEPDYDFSGKRILLAEDNEINAEIAKSILEGKGCAVDVAENGVAALEAFSGNAVGYYDAILMDVRMPVMDGLEATRTIRAMKKADGKTIPILAMTANAFQEDVDATQASGMNAHLAKPIEPGVLYDTLERFLKR